MHNRELDRIRFVAGHFGALQGWRAALIGGAYLAAFGISVLVSGWPPDEEITWTAMGLALLVTVFLMLRLDRVYAANFGRTGGGQRLSWGYFIPGGMMLALYLDRSVTAPGTPGIFFLACAAVAAAAVIRDWQYRAHHAIDVVAGVAAAFVFAAIHAAGGFATAFATGLAVVGGAMIVTGLLDHRILATTLRRSPEANHADSV